MRTKCVPKYLKSTQCVPNVNFADLFGSTGHEVAWVLSKGCRINGYFIQLWIQDGSIDKRDKNFQNMRHLPLLKGDPENLILDLVAIPELHLVLGNKVPGVQ